ncbi:MAG: Smr/MutS family protein, partial [Anaerolineae bacterium]|nr:Smr/MutS family protein [Anaerolineae bacterium]
QLERELRQKLAAIEEARRQVLNEARREGLEELEQLRNELRELRFSLARRRAPAEVVEEALTKVEQLAEELAPVEAEVEPLPEKGKELREGDLVFVTNLGQVGELVRLGEHEAEVRVGGFRLRTRPELLEFRERPGHSSSSQKGELVIKPPKVSSPGVELDLRGLRVEEALPAVEKHLEEAYLAGLPWVRIIHGKGTGTLKRMVRELLGRHPLVAEFRPGGLGEGGDGVTVVTLHRLDE